MPRVPTLSPATEKPTNSFFIHTVDNNFVDTQGRTLLLRGVNLSGSSKAPVGEPSYLRDQLWDGGESGDETFLGRPLDIEDGSADIHLARLKGWGFNVLRYPVTWEALEHDGPGEYDHNFIDYTVRVLRKCKEYGFKVYIDPHQDVWSRFSGGSGAPYWTLLACGIDPHNFTATQAAILHSEYPVAHEPEPEKFPAMIWSTNYGRLASQTLFTLFFAGKDYAPKCIIDGMNIQDYLQRHFIAAFGVLADKIRDAGDLLDECVIGWDSMNEPAEGFCGYDNLNSVPAEQGSTLRKGSRPTPAQSLRLGMGQEQTVEHWSFGAFGPKRDGSVTIDPKGYKMWLHPEDADEDENGVSERWGWRRDAGWELGTCIWALHGVWDVESGYVLRPEYFRCPPFDPDRPVVFEADFWRPHWRAYITRIRAAHPEAIHFVQPPVFAQPPPLDGPDDLRGRCCYSGHYYDGFTLVTRHWNFFNADALGMLRGKYSGMWQAVRIGEKAIRQCLRDQLGYLKSDTDILGPYPTLIGEIGVPFDMDNKKAYGYTDKGKYAGDYSQQEKALDASLNAADGSNALSYTIWTYCSDSSHKWGDGWNLEDLSLWSEDDVRHREQYTMRSAYASDAALLKRNNSQAFVRVNAVASASTPAVSAISLATLGGVSVASTISEDENGVAVVGDRLEDDEMKERHRERILAAGKFSAHPNWANPFDFLTDGARAVRAFVRPYPVAVVGLPKDINFDIGKAEFKLTVRVRREDRPVRVPLSMSSSRSSSSTTVNAAKKEENLAEAPTEIFVPLVHFARGDIVAKSVAAYEQTEERESRPPSRAKRSSREVSGSGNSNGNINCNNSSCDPSPTTLSSSASASTLHLPFATSTTPLASTPSMLDLDVRVSAGRWEVEGQYLRWWHPVPADEDGAPDMEHKIEIRRRRGAIKVVNQLAGRRPAALSRTRSRGLKGICQRVAALFGCCVF